MFTIATGMEVILRKNVFLTCILIAMVAVSALSVAIGVYLNMLSLVLTGVSLSSTILTIAFLEGHRKKQESTDE